MKTYRCLCAAFVAALLSALPSELANAAGNYGGTWWNPNQDGQGMVCDQHTVTVFCAMFAYGPNGKREWQTSSGVPQVDQQGRAVLASKLYTGTGALPLQFNSSMRNVVEVGSVVMVLAADGMSLSYAFSVGYDDGTVQVGTLNLVRMNWDCATAWDGEGCIAPTFGALHYSDKVYALWTGSYPFAVSETGAARVVNKTHFAGLAPFYSCWLPEKPLADGTILTSCRESVSNARYTFYIDPTQDAIYDYTGTVPADVVWHDVTPIAWLQPGVGSNTKVSDGWYFTPASATWVLNFQPNAGSVKTVKAGSYEVDGNISLLMTYNN